MTDFSALLPTSTFTTLLGDGMVYHAVTGDVEIKGFVDDYIDPVLSGDAHISARRKKIEVAADDAPGIKLKSELTHSGTRYIVEDIISNDGQFIGCVVRKK